jgi:lysophospholipid acyltransferase (LPLAT)-like uncharacterized protein
LRQPSGFGNVPIPDKGSAIRETKVKAKSEKKEKGAHFWFRLILFLLPRLVTGYSKIIDLTCRKVFINREYEEEVCKKRPFNCACFHGTMLFPVYYCRRYPGVIMVSRSWDGELIDRCLRRWGYDTVRGSSSRGGKEALAEMIEMIKAKNYCSGLAVDAPRGPARKVKMGIIATASETGNPIVPMVSWATRQIQFNSWDNMIVPLPFSTIVLAFGKPTEIPSGLEKDEYELLREKVEREMIEVSRRAEQLVTNFKECRHPVEGIT